MKWPQNTSDCVHLGVWDSKSEDYIYVASQKLYCMEISLWVLSVLAETKKRPRSLLESPFN